MNPVFWLVAILALVGIWFMLSSAFKGVGGFAVKQVDKAKKEMSDENKEKEDNKDE